MAPRLDPCYNTPMPSEPDKAKQFRLSTLMLVTLVVGFFALAAVSLYVAAKGIWYFSYTINRFDGDGTISDSGWTTNQRYRINFPHVSVVEDGRYTFHCKGLPPVRLFLGFRIDGTGENALERVGDASVLFRVVDARGRIVGEASGPLDEWQRNWRRNRRGSNTYFYHPDCSFLRMSQDIEYTLTIVVEGDDTLTGPIVLEPILEGGGIEVP